MWSDRGDCGGDGDSEISGEEDVGYAGNIDDFHILGAHRRSRSELPKVEGENSNVKT